jgi:hypothetical protein
MPVPFFVTYHIRNFSIYVIFLLAQLGVCVSEIVGYV